MKNIKERIELIKAMELIARCVNDENVFINTWLSYGIADGDITDDTTDDDLEDYTEDDTFADLMGTFLYLMRKASKSGLYCDGILSTE